MFSVAGARNLQRCDRGPVTGMMTKACAMYRITWWKILSCAHLAICSMIALRTVTAKHLRSTSKRPTWAAYHDC
eukprot:15256-Heterococcus_DN1.PRE.4